MVILGIKNPKGILQKGEVYCKDFKDNKKLACLRSPHLYREWPIRINNKNTEIEYWFGNTKCIYTSCHDLISKYYNSISSSRSNPSGNYGI